MTEREIKKKTNKLDIKWRKKSRKRYGEREKSLRDTNKREKQRVRERDREKRG